MTYQRNRVPGGSYRSADGGGERKPSTYTFIRTDDNSDAMAIVNAYDGRMGRMATISLVVRDDTARGLDKWIERQRFSQVPANTAIDAARKMLSDYVNGGDNDDI